eukprot:GHVO01049708.1.p1 GENE.GHVO01049708.1~~GHVO01049708.1.p1  ORF type:complete len:674 (+),score=81.66 GHVO01049708.1:58-2022(+)
MVQRYKVRGEFSGFSDERTLIITKTQESKLPLLRLNDFLPHLISFDKPRLETHKGKVNKRSLFDSSDHPVAEKTKPFRSPNEVSTAPAIGHQRKDGKRGRGNFRYMQEDRGGVDYSDLALPQVQEVTHAPSDTAAHLPPAQHDRPPPHPPVEGDTPMVNPKDTTTDPPTDPVAPVAPTDPVAPVAPTDLIPMDEGPTHDDFEEAKGLERFAPPPETSVRPSRKGFVELQPIGSDAKHCDLNRSTGVVSFETNERKPFLITLKTEYKKDECEGGDAQSNDEIRIRIRASPLWEAALDYAGYNKSQITNSQSSSGCCMEDRSTFWIAQKILPMKDDETIWRRRIMVGTERFPTNCLLCLDIDDPVFCSEQPVTTIKFESHTRIKGASRFIRNIKTRGPLAQESGLATRDHIIEYRTQDCASVSDSHESGAKLSKEACNAVLESLESDAELSCASCQRHLENLNIYRRSLSATMVKGDSVGYVICRSACTASAVMEKWTAAARSISSCGKCQSGEPSVHLEFRSLCDASIEAQKTLDRRATPTAALKKTIASFLHPEAIDTPAQIKLPTAPLDSAPSFVGWSYLQETDFFLDQSGKRQKFAEAYWVRRTMWADFMEKCASTTLNELGLLQLQRTLERRQRRGGAKTANRAVLRALGM